MTEGLGWPPKKEDLERMYLLEGLSAAKIATAYGLKYRSPKVAESTVLYQLKKNGIARRDRAEHVRKVTQALADEWVRRYEGGESLKRIAGGQYSPASVMMHLKKRGVKRREKVEAQIRAVTKHEKRPFVGGPLDRAYLIGFRYGDLHVVRHGRAVRVRVSTTHPAMVQLFFDLFGKYGPIYKYPSRSPLTEFEWSLDCDLDPSFEFLVHPEEELVQILDSEDAFMAFLAGFFDADGSIFFHRKQSHGGFEFTLTNMDFSLLESIATRLGQVGLHPRMRKSPQKHERGVKNGAPWIWKMSLWRHEEVARMLRRLELRHHEKQSKKALALRLKYRSPDSERGSLLAEWDRLRASIKEEIAACIELAKNAHKAKFGVEMQK